MSDLRSHALRYHRTLRALALPCLLGVTVAACDCDPPVTGSSGILALRQKSVDFGTACVNVTSERTLVLANIGGGPLKLESATLSHPAFSLLEDLPDTLRRGEDLVVRVGFTPEAEIEYAGTLTVSSNARENGTQSATLVGRGFVGKEQDFQAECSYQDQTRKCFFLAFDSVLAGQSLEQEVTVTNRGCRPVNVTDVRIAPDGKSGKPEDVEHFAFVENLGPFRLNGGESRNIRVRFTAPNRADAQLAMLLLTTDDPEKKDNRWPAGQWEVSLQASSTLPALAVNPDILTFFDAPTARKSFRISNNGTASLEITEVTLVHEEGPRDFTLDLPRGESRFTLPAPGLGDSERDIGVQFSSTGGSTRATVKVVSPSETAEVRLIGGTQPVLVVKWLDDANQERDPPVDFGEVATGQQGIRRTLLLRNEGLATLRVQSATLTPAEGQARSFVVDAFSARDIAPGAAAEVGITFNDNVQVRDDTDKLVIASNDSIDAALGGSRSIDLRSRNEPNFNPIPRIEVRPSAPQTRRELTLDASGTTGPEPGDTLTFQWRVTKQPTTTAGARAESENQPVTRIVSDPPDPAAVCPPGPTCPFVWQPGQYTFRLRVTDQFNNWEEISQVVNVYGGQ